VAQVRRKLLVISPEGMLVSIGQALSAARTERGLTIRDISDATRVRQTLIRAIENDDFSLCGGDFYARGHIRTIAHVLDIDPAPLLEEFDAARSGAAEVPMAQAFESEAKAARPQRSGPNWTAAMGAALIVVVILGIVRLVGGGEENADVPSAAVPAATQPPVASKSASPAPTKRDAVAMADRVVVRLTAKGASWVSVRTGSGKELFEGTLYAGDTKQFTDRRRIRLIVGDAAAIRLNVNGEDIGTPGGQGEVIRLDFEPGDPAQSSG
jgi:cytoskeletal protein RodZ